MRSISCSFVILAAFVLPISAVAAQQQLSAHASRILEQEHTVGWDLESANKTPITIGPDSRNDRRAMLVQCETVLEKDRRSVEQQFGYEAAVDKAASLLASSVDLLGKVRRGQREMGDLQQITARFEYDYTGSGRTLYCFLSKALLLAGGASAPVQVTVANPPPQSSELRDATRLAAIEASQAEWRAFSERYPAVPTWTATEVHQYRLFMGTNALAIINRYKSNMAKEDYDAIVRLGIEMRDQGRAGCPACKVEYPVKQLVAGLDTPSASFQAQYRAAQDNYASNAELESTMQQLANKANNPSGTTMGAFAGALTNAGKPSLIHNRANDATACIRVEPTGAQMEWGIEGRYRLRNSCSYPISASWCANTDECGGNRGNMWTIAPGKDWPIYFADVANPNIQVGACKAGDARQPPLGQQGVERTGFNAGRDTPAPAPGVSLLTRHRCD